DLSLAASDLDGRPGVEIIVTSTSPDLVSVLRGDGSSLPNWPRRLPLAPIPPVVTRLGHDPRPVVVVAAGNTLHAFDADGSERWENSFPGITREPLAVADLDGDGSDEIILPQTSVIAVID